MGPPRTVLSGWSVYSSSVTTPKFAPAPRNPQKSSAFSWELHSWILPSAVTISAHRRLSQASPYLPASQPYPPPRVRPPIPVVVATPRVVASPYFWVSRSNSPRVRPVCARATERDGSTVMPFIKDRSNIKPAWQTDLPAKLCPPPRTDKGTSWSRAKLTHIATSVRLTQRAINAGRLSTIPLKTFRAVS